MVTPNSRNVAESMPRAVEVQRGTSVLTYQKLFAGNTTHNVTSSLPPFQNDVIKKEHLLSGPLMKKSIAHLLDLTLMMMFLALAQVINLMQKDNVISDFIECY